MDEYLDKAKAAAVFAKELHQEHERDPHNGMFRSKAVDITFSEARATANIYAAIAQAEALDRIASALEFFMAVKLGTPRLYAREEEINRGSTTG